MARITVAVLLVAAVAHTDAMAVGCLPLERHIPSLPLERHHQSRAAPVIMQVSGSDEGGDQAGRDEDPDFSEESRRRMAQRLNGVVGLPQDSAAVGLPQDSAAVDEASRRPSATGIPFIDTHFPSRRDMMRDARAKLAKLTSGLEDVPRIGVHIDEDESGFTVLMTCSGVAVGAEQLDVALEEGVLMLTLAADASSRVLVPVPLPADAASEVASVTLDDEGTVTVRVEKDPTRPADAHGDAEISTADASEEGEEGDAEVLERLARVLKAFGVSMRADE